MVSNKRAPRWSAAPLLGVLGPLALTIAGSSVPLRGARERKLLALLAVNLNELVPVERIEDALWESPPKSVRQQLYNVVANLRRVLAVAPDLELSSDGGGYRLMIPPHALDASRFRALIEEADTAEQQGRWEEADGLLDEALGLWRGPALDGLNDWTLRSAAALLDSQRLNALERWAGLRLRLGGGASAVDRLHAAVVQEPLREPLRALLMLALHDSGRQSEAIAVFEDGRKALADELGLDPGQQLREAHQRILTADEDPAEEVARSGRRIPSLLPRDIREFTGREDELRALGERVADPSALSITVIDGMGGVGKTSLTVHLAHRLADDYPDGQYFIDLAGFSDLAEPMDPMQALNLLLRFGGMAPELIAPDPATRSAQWRSSVAGHRVLLILDNAADAAQVRPLLPSSAGSLVMISSRRRMASLEGTTSLSLDVMTETDAFALFCRIAGPQRVSAEHAEVRVVVALCGYLPLAIQIAAARLRERTSWRVSFLAEQLQDTTSRARILTSGDRDVMNVIVWSYRHLTPRQQRLLALLSLHSGPDFDVLSTSALADLEVEQVEEDLDKLFELNLLKQHLADRYHLHDIVRDCSARLLQESTGYDEAADAVSRLADYFLWSAGSWCSVLSKSSLRYIPEVARRPDRIHAAAGAREATALLDTEFRNIAPLLRLAMEYAVHDQVWKMMRTLQPYFEALDYPLELKPLFEAARSAAQVAGNPTGEASCLAGLAAVERTHGSLSEAVALGELALGLSRRAQDRLSEAVYLSHLGITHWLAQDLNRAHRCYAEALEAAQALDAQQLQASLTNNLAIISQELGDNAGALRRFCEAGALETDAPASTRTNTWNNIAFVSVILGDWHGAAEVYERSLELARTAGVGINEALALVGLCIVFRGLDDPAQALTRGREALDVARRTNVWDAEAQALCALGDVHACTGGLETAEQIYRQCLEAARSRGSARHAARAHEGLAHLESLRGNLPNAESHWREALAVTPGGVVDPAGVERHLAAPHMGGAACWRCDVRTAAASTGSTAHR